MDMVAMLENKDGKDKDIVWLVRRQRSWKRRRRILWGYTFIWNKK